MDSLVERLKGEVRKAVVGKEDVTKLLTVALLARGHALLEGVPGVAKTTIAKSFADAVGLSFSRIQLTPDLMPADLTGGAFYSQKNSEFRVRKGPIFANVVLADELNRATPKTQSALLEAMQEGQVTIEGTAYKLPRPFLLVATMNPVETEGVYTLPEAQLDRFMLKIQIGYLSEDDEIAFLKRKDEGETGRVERIVDGEEINEWIGHVSRVRVSEAILRYIHRLVRRTRTDERTLLGGSPRTSEHLLFASKALAFSKGRDYVIPDDVKELANNVICHRISLKAEYDVDGLKPDEVIREVIEEVEVPKSKSTSKRA